MIPPFLVLICLAAITTSSPLFEFRGNEQTSDTENTAKCCSVSHCKEIPLYTEGHNVFQCYKTEVCGDECINKQKKVPPLPLTYRRKNYYMKKICQLYQCDDYIFDCRRCPDPRRSGFNAYNIDSDCINCYYAI